METNSVFVPISDRYRARFGGRVQFLPVQIAETCPNRLGLKGMQTCVFCDEWGSAAYNKNQGSDLEAQIQTLSRRLGERYSSYKYLVYFQAYTSGFMAVQKLRHYFESALRHPGVVGIVLGTRPDCLPNALLRLCEEFSQRCYVSIELGVQTFSERQLLFLRRGHSAALSFEAIERVKEFGEIELGIHLMFGLPEETLLDVEKTAEQVASLPIDHVKLHNLHVLKNTPLEDLYRRGEFQPLELENYADRVASFLRKLPRRIAIQRLAAVSSRWDELVAPDWTRYKMRSHQFIIDRMRARGEFQGQDVQPARLASTRDVVASEATQSVTPVFSGFRGSEAGL